MTHLSHTLIMRLFLLFVFFFLIAAESLGQQHPPYPHWRVYRVKKGDWLYKLSRDLKNQNIIVVNHQDLIKRILIRNPQIKDRHEIKMGEEILVPFSAKRSVVGVSKKTNKISTQDIDTKDSKVRIVNYHYYYNSTVYQGVPDTVEDVGERRPSNFSPPVQDESSGLTKESSLSVRKEVPRGDSNKYKMSVEPFYQFSKITATENSDGSEASLVSESSLGIRLGLSHKLFSKYKILYFASYTEEVFTKPVTNLVTANFEQSYMQFGAALLWPLAKGLTVKPYLALREKSYINAGASSISVEKVSHPLVGSDIDYKFYSFSNSRLYVMGSFSYFLPGTGEKLEVDGGVSYGLGLGYGGIFWGQELLATTWLKLHDSSTSGTQQSSQDLGVSLSWQSSF